MSKDQPKAQIDVQVTKSDAVASQSSDELGTSSASVPLFSLWRYATPGERVFAVFGAVIACISGASLPAFALIFGGAWMAHAVFVAVPVCYCISR